VVPAGNVEPSQRHSDNPEGPFSEEWVTVQCVRGKPLVLKNGEWDVLHEKATFCEWILYALWLQQNRTGERQDIRIRSHTSHGEPLVSYQAQVLREHVDLLWELIRTPWLEMRCHYRRTENYGGASAPKLKWGVQPRVDPSVKGDETGSISSRSGTASTCDTTFYCSLPRTPLEEELESPASGFCTDDDGF
jgi:hypothetical protein